METPQAAGLAELKITVPEMVSASSIAAESAHQTKVAPETPMKPAEPTYIAPETPAVSERVEIAPDTPVRESMSKRYFEDPETCEQETRPSNSFTFFDECLSEFCEDRRDLDAILMNEEVNAHETEDLQQETWSARTRNVAKFLEKTFLEQREKGEEEKASLLQLCRGRTQKESARLFYETLVLKTKGYLEVKQDHPYSDILLSRFTGRHEASYYVAEGFSLVHDVENQLSGFENWPFQSPVICTLEPEAMIKKKTLASSSRIWNEEDELTVLKGLVDYQAQKGNEPKSNWADFYRFLGGSITGKFSKEQVLTKIRKLKAKFIASMQKGNTSKSEAFLLSKRIWGLQNVSDQSANHTKSGEEMANHEPSNNEVTKADFEGNDESWAVRDAFETMVSKGLSDYQKKLQLGKLMNLGSGKRRELSDEWKELCAEEVKLNIKRFKFSAVLAEAAKW
ncbi:hypothetical protein F2Q68_00044689 [Brassica cretica]|uniref:Rad21/Rec8-like protein C-terminal eukaryotic domain-containing protein n=1 Tax=Brassica cretica TaxID=69181 RepID=A0A8S9LQW1_BRACR|nr:hypothetical protein F2Q68_00044689 [Brassica cretica]